MNPNTVITGRSQTRTHPNPASPQDNFSVSDGYDQEGLRVPALSFSDQESSIAPRRPEFNGFIRGVKESSSNHRLKSGVNLSVTEAYSSSTAQRFQPSSEGETVGCSPGNLALISTPSLNQGISGLPNKPTTLSSESEDVTTYEKLYPGFDPKQDLEVNLASCITICRWGNCQGVWCRLDKMWCDHIFGDYNTPEGAWHKAEILAPHNQLPDQKVKCLWRNCERTFPVDGLKKHVEDEHLLLYRLRCIHCGTENRDGPYRRTHGPASMCPQNPRFKQRNLAVPKSTPNPQVPQQTLPIDGTAHALNGTSNLDNLSSSSTLVANTASKYQDSLGRRLDKRFESLWSSRYARGPTTRADVATEPAYRTPAAILSLHPQQYKANRYPAVASAAAAASISSSPRFIAPDLLVARQLADAHNVSQVGSVFTSKPMNGEGARRDPRGGRASHWALQPQPTQAPPTLGPQAVLARSLNARQRAAERLPQNPSARFAPSVSPPLWQSITPELLASESGGSTQHSASCSNSCCCAAFQGPS